MSSVKKTLSDSNHIDLRIDGAYVEKTNKKRIKKRKKKRIKNPLSLAFLRKSNFSCEENTVSNTNYKELRITCINRCRRRNKNNKNSWKWCWLCEPILRHRSSSVYASITALARCHRITFGWQHFQAKTKKMPRRRNIYIFPVPCPNNNSHWSVTRCSTALLSIKISLLTRPST